jgi:hypothetical protein
MNKLIFTAIFLFLSSGAHAMVQGKEVTYNNNGETLKGYLAYEGRDQGQAPGRAGGA